MNLVRYLNNKLSYCQTDYYVKIRRQSWLEFGELKKEYTPVIKNVLQQYYVYLE